MFNGGEIPSMKQSPSTQQVRRKAHIRIVEQPASRALRFRYECEGRSAGSIPGASSTLDNKTFPTIQVVGFQGRAVVVVSCVTKDTPHRPHPHSLVGREGCKKGVCTLEMPPETMTVQFSNLGIQCVKKKDIEQALKVREEIRVDPFRTGFGHRNQPTTIDLNAVRLCFQVFVEGSTPGKFTVPLTPVVSNPIYDKKAITDLCIFKLSHCTSYVDGGKDDMILLCEKVAKEDIQVRFFEENSSWEAFADIQPTQVYKQVAIVFKTPKYKTVDVTEPVKVFIQLRRPSDGVTSESLPFEFLPIDSEPGALKRKRQKIGNPGQILRHLHEHETRDQVAKLDTVKIEPRDTSPSPYHGNRSLFAGVTPQYVPSIGTSSNYQYQLNSQLNTNTFGNTSEQIEASTGKMETFELLLQKSIRTALSLKEKGIKAGDIVPVCSRDHLNKIVPIIASTFIRAIPCLVSSTVSATELEQLLEETKPKLFFISDELLYCTREVLKSSDFETEIVVFGENTEFISFESFLTFRNEENYFQANRVDDKAETCAIIYRNTATGTSKLICKTHYYYLNSFYSFQTNSDNVSSFINYSTKSDACLENLILSALKGQSRLIFNSFSTSSFWKDVSNYKISDVSLDYNQIVKLMTDDEPEGSITHLLKRIIIVINNNLKNQNIFTLLNFMPEIELMIIHENIEIGPLALLKLDNKNKELPNNNPGVMGLPVPGLRYRVVDLKTERNCGPNEEGELRVKGLTINSGNYGNVSPNRFDKHGWFKTGEIVRYDDNCFFFLTDKECSKNQIGQEPKVPIKGKVPKYTYNIDENHIITAPVNLPLDKNGLGHLLFNSMKRYSNDVAQYITETSETDTYGELLKRCVRVALHLQQNNLKKDDVILLCTHNHKNACVPVLAAFFQNILVSSIDPSLSVLEATHLIKEVQPKIIFVASESVELIEISLLNIGIAPDIIVFGGSSKYRNFEELLQADENEDMYSPTCVDSLADPLVIVFTSGTTGSPKGIALNHQTLMSQGMLCCDLDLRAATLVYSTYYWVSAYTYLSGAILSGGARLVCSQFNPVEFWYLLDRYRVKCFATSSIKTISILEVGRPENIDTSSLTHYLNLGDTISENNLRKLRDQLPGTIILRSYGLSEASGFLTLFKQDPYELSLLDQKVGSVGTPTLGFSFKIVDPQTEKICGPYEQGELRVKSKIMTNGYFNRDSSELFDSNGWLRTGDILYYDEDLCFFFVDRIKLLLKYRSYMVFPAAIEKVILEHPAVQQAVVFGLRHPEDGDHPIAIVIPSNKHKDSITPDEIQKFVADRVPDRMKLRGGVKILDSFPVTPTGKVNWRKLKHMILEGEK